MAAAAQTTLFPNDISSHHPTWLVNVVIALFISFIIQLFLNKKDKPITGRGYTIGDAASSSCLPCEKTCKLEHDKSSADGRKESDNRLYDQAQENYSFQDYDTKQNISIDEREVASALTEYLCDDAKHDQITKSDGGEMESNKFCIGDKCGEESSSLSLNKKEIDDENSYKTPLSSPHSSATPPQSSQEKTNDQGSLSSKQTPSREINIQTASHPSTQSPPHAPLRTTSRHPGLKPFHAWHDTLTSLYRIYTIGKIPTSSSPIIPITPKSERGHVSIALEVTNRTPHTIHAYWIDYRGKEIHRGSAPPMGGIWSQLTWIGHPWIFRGGDQGDALLLHFIPYRVIPTTKRVHTVSRSSEDGDIGVQRFAITAPGYKSMIRDDICSIHDDILPYPSEDSMTTVEMAVEWCCHQMEREKASPRTLLRYLVNILSHPSDPKYRRIRMANAIFKNDVWINAGRGILYALGFVEHGAYLEMGPDVGGLPGVWLQQISGAIFQLELLQKAIEGVDSIVRQPRGADGSGRANFGTAGQMN